MPSCVPFGVAPALFPPMFRQLLARCLGALATVL